MQRFGYGLLVAALACVVMALVVFVGEGIDAYYRSRLVDMVHGTAYRPYVYRVLVPGAARIGTAMVPAGVKRALTRAFEAWPQRPAGWVPAFATEYLLVVLVMAGSLVGFVWALRRFFRAVFPEPPARVVDIASLVALGFVPVFFGPFSRQIYDFTTLWLFALGLALMAESKWRAYAILFPLACLNKETAILLALVFVVHFVRTDDRVSPRDFRRLLVWQLAVFAVLRAAVTYAFRNNPGEAVELHLFDHNQWVLLHPQTMSKRLPLLIAVCAAGAWGWRGKPQFLRDAFLTLAPILLVIGVTVGQIDEIRVYYELYPLVVLMAADSACRALGTPLCVSRRRGDAVTRALA